MSIQDIPPIAGVPDDLVRILNDRLRRLQEAPTNASQGGSVLRYYRGTLFGPDDRPVLGTGDADARFYATDFGREYRWTGRAWELAHRGDPQGRIEFFRVDPGLGWHVCDGSAGVRSSKADGSTELLTIPDSSACVLKDGLYTGTAVAATAPGISGSTSLDSAGTPAGIVSRPTFAGDALGMHQHETAMQFVAGSNALYRSAPFGTGTLKTAQTVLTGVASAASISAELTQAVSAGTPAGTVSQPTFGGSALGTHSHTKGTLAVDTTGEPKRLLARAYMRL